MQSANSVSHQGKPPRNGVRTETSPGHRFARLLSMAVEVLTIRGAALCWCEAKVAVDVPPKQYSLSALSGSIRAWLSRMDATTNTDLDLIRTVHLRPYRRGMGPWFRLHLYDLGRPFAGGPQSVIGYDLDAFEDGKRTRVFDGDDFGCSPLHAIDSDQAVRGLLSFLTLRPGDADADYFEGYDGAQLAFADEHAEALAAEADCRFGAEG